jgi:hypothetical protein
MNNFLDLFGSGSDRTSQDLAQPRMGVVTSSDAQTATARVLLQPEGVLTGWLPVLTQWAGAGWGIACPPSPGDQVLIIFQEGSAEHGIIVGCLFSNSTRPPQTNIGEITLLHQSGSSIRLLNSGIIAISGDLHVSGDIYDTHGSLNRLRGNYDVHIHHTSNGGVTSGPLPQD